MEFTWHKLTKKPPRKNEVVLLRQAIPDAKTYLALFENASGRWYIFNLYTGHWTTFENYFAGIDAPDSEDRTVRCTIIGWEYAYVSAEDTKKVTYWALANARKGDICG